MKKLGGTPASLWKQDAYVRVLLLLSKVQEEKVESPLLARASHLERPQALQEGLRTLLHNMLLPRNSVPFRTGSKLLWVLHHQEHQAKPDFQFNREHYKTGFIGVAVRVYPDPTGTQRQRQSTGYRLQVPSCIQSPDAFSKFKKRHRLKLPIFLLSTVNI